MKLKPTFVSKNFKSGQRVLFTVYNEQAKIIFSGLGKEWALTGVYYIDLEVPITSSTETSTDLKNKFYLVIAEEINGVWKSAKLFNLKDAI